MASEPTTIEKLRGIPWSIATFAANTFFVQFTFFGSVFPLFLAELGLSKGQMGFLFSLMPFLGLIAPFIGPWTARFGYKRTFLTFFGVRKIFTVMLLATPLWAVQPDEVLPDPVQEARARQISQGQICRKNS